MLQLLKHLRSRSQGKEDSEADILMWADKKMKHLYRISQMENFKDKNLSSTLVFLGLLSAVEPRVVIWNLVTKGKSDEEKKLNSAYIISVARKIGCSVFLQPEDIMDGTLKMNLTLMRSIMYWSLQQPMDEQLSLLPVVSSHEASLEHSCFLFWGGNCGLYCNLRLPINLEIHLEDKVDCRGVRVMIGQRPT